MFVNNYFTYIIVQNKSTNVTISNELQIQEDSEDLLLEKNSKILNILEQALENVLKSSDAQSNRNEIKQDLQVIEVA